MTRFDLLLWLLLLSSYASAQAPPVADAHYAKGRGHYVQKRYAEAATEFGAAYAANPQPRFIYNKAQAERLDGNCEAAVESYRAFLATEPADHLRNKADGNLKFCEGELDKSPPPTPGPVVEPTAPQPTVPPPAPVEPDEVTESSPFYADVAGGFLFGGGVVVMAVGGGLLGWSFSLESSATDAQSATYQEHVDQIASAERSRVAGIVMLSTGAALLIGGIIRYALASTDDTSTAFRAGPCSYAFGVRCSF